MENRAEQLLESYFANELTVAETAELNSLAAKDPALAAEMAFQKRIAKGVQANSLSGSIQNAAWRTVAENGFPAVAVKVSMWSRYTYAAAAAIALLIAAVLFFQSPSLQTVVADNSTEYSNKMRFKSLGNESEGISAEIMAAFSSYDQGAYSDAAKALQGIVAAHGDRLDYRFYWGVSLVQDKQYAAAVTALNPVAQAQNEYQVPAMFYLGLACAATKDLVCARQNLQAYVDSPNGVTFRKEAKTVLEALK
jgi:hypothetical protein